MTDLVSPAVNSSGSISISTPFSSLALEILKADSTEATINHNYLCQWRLRLWMRQLTTSPAMNFPGQDLCEKWAINSGMVSSKRYTPASISESMVNFVVVQSAIRVKKPLRVKCIGIWIYPFILADRPETVLATNKMVHKFRKLTTHSLKQLYLKNKDHESQYLHVVIDAYLSECSNPCTHHPQSWYEEQQGAKRASTVKFPSLQHQQEVATVYPRGQVVDPSLRLCRSHPGLVSVQRDEGPLPWRKLTMFLGSISLVSGPLIS